MNKTKILKISLAILMVGLCTIIGVEAQVARDTSWSYAKYTNIPAQGRCLYKLTSEYRNVKKTSSSTVSIQGNITASLSGTSYLVNNDGALRSNAGALNGSVNHPYAVSMGVGYGYYNRACTQGLEWNEQDANVWYSSDNIQ